MKKSTAILTMAVAVLWAQGAGADSFRCGTRLVSDGDSHRQGGRALRAAHQHPAPRGPAAADPLVPGQPYYTSYEPVPIPIEYWIYNLGPNKLMRRLKFEDGLLVDVETLNHGYYSESDD